MLSSSVVPFPFARARDGVWEVVDGWSQGRGAWGGVVVAAAVRAAEEAEGSDGVAGRPVRALTVQILGPVPVGPVRVEAFLARRGSATAAWRVEVTDPAGGDLLAHAVVTLGDERTPDLMPLHEGAPAAPAWTDVPAVDISPPLGPVFAQHLEFRVVAGLPYAGATVTGSDRGEVLAWVRPADRPDNLRYDAGALIGLVDATWPTLLTAQTAPRPMATLSFDASLLVDPSAVDPHEPLLLRSWFVGLTGGYFAEMRQLWTPDGQLAVHNAQAMVVIR